MKYSGLGGRLYRGETSLNIIEARRKWYALSAVFIIVSMFSLGIQGLKLGIEFKGGSSFIVTTTSGTSVEDAAKVYLMPFAERTVIPPNKAMPRRNCLREKPSRPSGQRAIASSVIIAGSIREAGKSGEKSRL